jgi:hypothetical protein
MPPTPQPPLEFKHTEPSNPFDLRKGFPAWLGALVGVFAGFVYGLAGFFLLRIPNAPQMGGVLFLLLPLVVGATIALVTPRPIAGVAILSGMVSLLFCLATLISTHAEGILCAVLAFPVVFVALLIGVGIGTVLRKMIRPFESSNGTKMNALILALGPVLLFGGHVLEQKNYPEPRTAVVTTTMHLAAKPEEVWRNIQSLDSLAGRKPFLMHVGLPIPQKCVLEGTSVGSKRICYFDQGSIEESVLEWDPPRKMRLAIDRTNMPGRHWLSFNGAEYDLSGDATGTTITRTTTIRSTLRPAWYWGPFERWGVQSEHEYLFGDLAGRFSTAVQR